MVVERTTPSPAQLVWFKRDLRLRDNAVLSAACNNQPTALCYIIEPLMVDDPHMTMRHWRFVVESLIDLNDQLSEYGHELHVFFGSVESVTEYCVKTYNVKRVLSFEEVGLKHTFDRDLGFKQWCQNNDVEWSEYPTGGITRGLLSRDHWVSNWRRYVKQNQDTPQLDQLASINNIDDIEKETLDKLTVKVTSDSKSAVQFIQNYTKAQVQHQQNGGEKRAWYTLRHFLNERGKDYAYQLSNPTLARMSCSRLSPYLAWGNISSRQVWQVISQQPKDKAWNRTYTAFKSRLQWRSHFIQKFESECSMEFRPVNKAYLHYPYENGDTQEQHLAAWKNGETGIPLIDACMRAVISTGYLNFRMRAMLVSFLTHHLNVDWRRGVQHLGKQFLDYEPGIHYPQFQMQASVTGTNTIRLYNPLKQAEDHDKKGEFVKKWCPELNAVPDTLVHTPWLLSDMEQKLYAVVLGEDYPQPIIDVVATAKVARDRLWSFRDRDDVKREAYRILKQHSNPGSPRT